MLEQFKGAIESHPGFLRLLAACERLGRGEAVAITGVAGSLSAIIIASLREKLGRQTLVIARDEESAERLRDDLDQTAGNAALFTGRRQRGLQSEGAELVADVHGIRALLGDPHALVVTHPRGAAFRLPPPDRVAGLEFTVQAGAVFPLSSALERLREFGFQQKDFVETYGDFALRGGILDVYPFAGEYPVRLEYSGDSVESIREFDPLSQRSLRALQSAAIVPDLLSTAGDVQEDSSSLLHYLRGDALLVLEDPGVFLSPVAGRTESAGQEYLSREDLKALISRFPRVEILSLASSPDGVIDIGSHLQPAFNGSVTLLRRTLAELLQKGIAITVTCDSQSETARLKDLLGVSTPDEGGQATALDISRIQFSLEALHGGFVIPALSLALFTEHQIFNRLKRRGRRRTRRVRGISAREVGQLRKGDYVVHQDYGIGRFDGLKKIRVRNAEQEVVSLLYEENDRLYVNLNYIQKLQKYSSKEGHTPKLSRLGSPDWDRLKNRTKKRVKDIARDLIRLYARRKHMTGYAFQTDTPWQRELEASFMYEDTFDQAKATVDVKQDMEATFPMDRLVCGDVGFGKTEVAVRAAFKAVLDGKQVAVLVPTTILAMQHHATFRDRLLRYALAIEVLSRFKTKKEQSDILGRLKGGAVDVAIGTHRLLSKDVAFKDLGLLIIDEEHRFGVSAKEKLRQMRTEVDTLSLTATPIPRTLHFSLMGARDLSIIATPPRNRLPVLTEIARWDDRMIHDAVAREVHRGGQVYFVHDRIQKIEEITARLRAALPGVRVRYAHGQMHAHVLENTMVDFLEKKFDLLVCTKIIESGLDLPNVNTIIINRADRFGMAELYQLRGRVGRSNVQAYAYLLIPPVETLPRTTLQRLQALEEFTELGSGLNLAMRDLEIRGAGNLLGSEQSGFIESMGFETYTRILDEAVRELKEEEFRELVTADDRHMRGRAEATVEADLDAYIPESYVGNDTERVSIYRRIYQVTSAEQLEEIREELRDRFGTFPPEADNLFSLVRLRLAAAALGFVKVVLGGERLEVEFPPETDTAFYDGDLFQRIVQNVSRLHHLGAALSQVGKTLSLSANIGSIADAGDSAGKSLIFLTMIAARERPSQESTQEGK